ncbi:hypothetical protein Avbf_18448 [Armadillidium vulgare]|nr:hypothetical protein Avbf_18448 [Armadillidium vulgare]
MGFIVLNWRRWSNDSGGETRSTSVSATSGSFSITRQFFVFNRFFKTSTLSVPTISSSFSINR